MCIYSIQALGGCLGRAKADDDFYPVPYLEGYRPTGDSEACSICRVCVCVCVCVCFVLRSKIENSN
jgi:hypothetical protein